MTTSADTGTGTMPTFRAARPDDLDAIAHLLEGAQLPVAGVADLMATRASDFTVAIDERGEVVAVAGLEVCCDDALLRSVAVRDDWRRHGLGEALVRRVVCEAEARGLRALYLLTLTAEHYFPRFGFARTAREAVPPEIAATLEFSSACPASATVMKRTLAGAHPATTDMRA